MCLGGKKRWNPASSPKMWCRSGQTLSSGPHAAVPGCRRQAQGIIPTPCCESRTLFISESVQCFLAKCPELETLPSGSERPALRSRRYKPICKGRARLLRPGQGWDRHPSPVLEISVKRFKKPGTQEPCVPEHDGSDEIILSRTF